MLSTSSSVRYLSEPLSSATSASDVGGVYCVPNEVTKKLASHVLSREHRTQRDALQEWSFLVRPATQSVLGALASGADKGTHILVDGPAGAGKSTIVSQALVAAREAGWTLLHVPDARSLPHHRDLDPCLSGGDALDQNEAAMGLLRHFATLNGATSFEAPVRGSYTWGPQKMELPEGATYQQLFQLAEREERFATDVLCVLLQELCAPEAANPVLVTVDDANGLFVPPRLLDFELEPVERRRLKLVSAVEDLIVGALRPARGTVVAATTGHSDCPPVPELREAVSDVTAEVAEVGAFTTEETAVFCNYLRQSGWLSTRYADFDPELLRLTTGLNPRALFNELRAL